ncbi:MAG: spore germination protein [Gracilibacteraceae bacterium]|jgi:spore germination protein KA|nr:spore germination protein [Gracilibacteraceae bacterium]
MPNLFHYIKDLSKEFFVNRIIAKRHRPCSYYNLPPYYSASNCGAHGVAGNGTAASPASPTPAPNLDDAMTIKIIESLGSAGDMVTRTLMAGSHQINMVYLDGLIDTAFVSECIIRPLADNTWVSKAVSSQDLVDRLDWGGVYAASQSRQTDVEEIVTQILTGSVALIFNDLNMALTFDCKGFERRSVSEPTEEHTLKGPKDCFVETMRVNTATVRRKICSQDLAIENYVLGQDTNTAAVLVYLRGRVKTDLLDAVKKSLDEAKIEDMLSLSSIESLLVGGRLSPFPQILYTEKPDRFSAGILDGRVGIIVDGIPFAMILPYSFFDFFRMSADYNYKYLPSTIYRIMRFVLFFITIFLPGVFVALSNFHPEMLPSDLAMSLAMSRQGVPFPAIFEITLVLLAFHGLIQAGLGSWTSIGGTVSIVGALVLGDAAINARFISPSILVIVAITGICMLALQNFELLFASFIWQFIILLTSSFYGLLGALFAGLLLLYSLSRMETFGIPYLQPFETYMRTDVGWFPPSVDDLARKFRSRPFNTLRLKPKARKGR